MDVIMVVREGVKAIGLPMLGTRGVLAGREEEEDEEEEEEAEARRRKQQHCRKRRGPRIDG